MEDRIWNSKIEIEGKNIRNRIVFPPISTNWANNDGTVNVRVENFYRAIAEGGCGLIVLEGTAVSPEGKSASNSLCLYDERHLPGLKKLVNMIKENGCLSSLQINHVGGQGNPRFNGFQPIAPSYYDCRPTGFQAREMSLEEIADVRSKFVNAAILASKVGFDFIELHLAHGYLLHEFLSEHFNKRQDNYGGNFVNRTRLIREIISEIKERSDIIIGARISGEDYIPDGINLQVNQTMLPVFQKEGIGYFSVTAGIYETSKLKHEAMKRGEFFKYSRDLKKYISKKIICVGKILDLDSAEVHLREEDCDLVAIGRGLVADPYMIKKYLAGNSYNRCTECGECGYLARGKPSLECLVNKLK